MNIWRPSKYQRNLDEIKKLVEKQRWSANHDYDREVDLVLEKNGFSGIKRTSFNGEPESYTPKQLMPTVEQFLHYPNPFLAYLITYHVPPLVTDEGTSTLKMGLERAFERVHFIKPELSERALDFLANSLFVQPDLKSARKLYKMIGQPYIEGPFSKPVLWRLMEEGCIDPEHKSQIPEADLSIRNAVSLKARDMNEELTEMIVSE